MQAAVNLSTPESNRQFQGKYPLPDCSSSHQVQCLPQQGTAPAPVPPKGEPYLRYSQQVTDPGGHATCTRALPHMRAAVMKPRMPRKAAGVMVSVPEGLGSRTFDQDARHLNSDTGSEPQAPHPFRLSPFFLRSVHNTVT